MHLSSGILFYCFSWILGGLSSTVLHDDNTTGTRTSSGDEVTTRWWQWMAFEVGSPSPPLHPYLGTLSWGEGGTKDDREIHRQL